jgi:hypothetical protein
MLLVKVYGSRYAWAPKSKTCAHRFYIYTVWLVLGFFQHREIQMHGPACASTSKGPTKWRRRGAVFPWQRPQRVVVVVRNTRTRNGVVYTVVICLYQHIQVSIRCGPFFFGTGRDTAIWATRQLGEEWKARQGSRPIHSRSRSRRREIWPQSREVHRRNQQLAHRTDWP